MDAYAGRVLADRYRLPLPPGGAAEAEPAETRAFDTYSGQEVRVRQVPLPEFVDAEVLDGGPAPAGPYGSGSGATRRPAEPVVRRAVEAAQAAAQVPDHPLLDQVFDVFAEAGSLWIVSEHVPARPLSALLAEGPLNPFRAAEIAADVLTALRALHAHGWVHRNITARTVLVCDDGRVLLTGLAAGAAEEALCGYDPVPDPDDPALHPGEDPYAPGAGTYDPGYEEVYEAEYAPDDDEADAADAAVAEEETGPPRDPDGAEAYEPEAYEPGAYEDGAHGAEAYGPQEEYGSEPYGHAPSEVPPPAGPGPDPAPGPAHEPGSAHGPGPAHDSGSEPGPGSAAGPESVPYGVDPYGRAAPVPRPAAPPEAPAVPPSADARAARAGAIAAYRAATRAAAARRGEPAGLPAPAQPEPQPEPAPETPPPPPPAATRPGPAPQWWARAADDEDEGDDEEEGPRPPRVLLKGSWSDGPHASRDGSPPVSAGGGPALPALPAGYTAAPAPVPAPAAPERYGPAAERYRGPTTRLAAERARQTRIAVVGAVTERWAPEQAGPVHENWRLAPPIGPATDLWALGALLYRAVQGHAPYPEDSAAELVQLVCAEPPAFAEECGPLRPVVESLLRQDPTERPDFEELRGWLRSLVRSAPEPEPDVVAPPSVFDAKRLPILRRRGELVRRRRGARHRHRRGKEDRRAPAASPLPPEDHEPTERFPPYGSREPYEAGEPQESREPYASPEAYAPQEPYAPEESYEEREPYERGAAREPYAAREAYEEPVGSGRRYDYAEDDGEPDPPRRTAAPRSRGRMLVLLVFLLLGGGVAYAVVGLPGGGEEPAGARPSATAPEKPAGAPSTGPATDAPPPAESGTTPPSSPAKPPAPSAGPALAAGYALRQDPEGFRIGVPADWRRSPLNGSGQVRYGAGDFAMIVVPGRDRVQDNGSDPLEYQNSRERELEPYRQSSWARQEKARRVDIGRTPTAEGHYVWYDGTGREVFVRNLALIDRGRYYVVQVIGPENERDKVSEIYDQAVKGFRPGR
ncbi:protein kinase [Streptomyces termitum]